MASFREQMQRLADNILRTRNERKAFVAQNHRDCEKMRLEMTQQRDQTKRQLEKQATTLVRKLDDFNRHNRKSVARNLRDTRQVRLSLAKAFKSTLRQEIAKNRRNVARVLRQNNSDRKRNQRLQNRAAMLTLQSVKSQVQRIRNSTARMTKALTNDRHDAKQIWMRLQNNGAATPTAPAVVRAETITRIPGVATVAMPGLSGLVSPPGMARHSAT